MERRRTPVRAGSPRAVAQFGPVVLIRQFLERTSLAGALVKPAPFLLVLLMVVSGQGLPQTWRFCLNSCAPTLWGTTLAPDRRRADLASSLYDAQHRVMLTGCRGGYASFQVLVTSTSSMDLIESRGTRSDWCNRDTPLAGGADRPVARPINQMLSGALRQTPPIRIHRRVATHSL